ncbi:ATJ49, partial [Symbiodinium microadriaticum]
GTIRRDNSGKAKMVGSSMMPPIGTTGILPAMGSGGQRADIVLTGAHGILTVATHGNLSGGVLHGKGKVGTSFHGAAILTGGMQLPPSNRRLAEEETWTGEATGSVDEGSRDEQSSSKATAAKSGKDFIPEFDGTAPMREYQRRVNLFEISTTIDPSFRAQKLMEKLTGTAWLATESIPLESLKHPDGVKRLMDHLWKELEPLEFLRTFQTLADFYKGFRRQRGQEFVAYDMEFRRHNQRLEEIGAGLAGVTKAYWFLEKAGLSSELRKQVVAAAGGQYDYAKLRSAVMAIVPQVHREGDTPNTSSQPSSRQWRKATAKVHATLEAEEGELAEEPDEEAGNPLPEAEMLEEELQCLMTQAARKRAQIERARGYGAVGSGKGGRSETPEARTKRIAELKQKMPCSACKAHGKTVYGHWHSDPECPFGSSKKGARPGGDRVLAVVEENSSSDSDHIAPGPTDIFMATEYWCASAISEDPGGDDNRFLALSDTCCARSVAGERWAKTHMRHLHEQDVDVYIVDEERPFRFGAGPRVVSTYSMVFPVHVRGAATVPWIRVSIVPEEVPLLLSKGALKALGARLDLATSKIELTRIGATANLVETSAGLCGFMINEPDGGTRDAVKFPPADMLEGEAEIGISDQARGDDEATGDACVHVAVEPTEGCEQMAQRLLCQRDFTFESLEKLAELLPELKSKQRAINGDAGKLMKGLTAGLWAHGNFRGVTKTKDQFPCTIRYINEFVKDKAGDSWTSFVLLRNVRMNLHRDCHNAPDSTSLTMSFGQFQGGQLWIAGPPTDSGNVEKYRFDEAGHKIEGHLVDTYLRPHRFDPKLKHATQACGVKSMAAKFTAPKRKEEYVQAILARSTIDVTLLRKHDVERLKQIWTMVKPQKPASPLPVGWKKLDVAALKLIYEKEVRPDLGRDDDGHWLRWHRPQLITEIDMWRVEVLEANKDAPEDLFRETPLCSQCAIPMVVRTNRVTKTDFFGCLMFPMCTETLPYKYAGMATKQAQDLLAPQIAKMKKEKEIVDVKSGKGYGTKGLHAPKRREKDFAEERGMSSDGSWIPAGSQPIEETEDEQDRLYNANVTAEEMKILDELRRAKRSEAE